MRHMRVRAICVALFAGGAACIVEGTAPTRQDKNFWSDDDRPTTLPSEDEEISPAPPRLPDPLPAPRRPRAVTIEGSAAPARRKAARADAELDAESQSRDRPVITNLDAKGEPVPDSTGAPLPQAAGEREPAARGTSESADALARSWPGARPIPLAEEGNAEYDESADPEPPVAGTEREPDSFVQPLRSYGRWIDTPDQGRVWLPFVDSGWQPYTDGVWSDTEYGWAFTSYDPWGWAVWHYGAWGYRDGLGWYWQPGRTWGPAWVSWRWGGGYACWRPIAPRGAGSGPAYDRAWVAVPAAHFTEPLYNGALIRGAATRLPIARSKPIPNPVARPVAGATFGPPVAAVAQAVGHPVVSAPATQLVRESTVAARSAANNERRAGGGASFFAPARNPTPNSTGTPRSTWREPNPDAIPRHRPQINYAQPAPGAAHPHSGATATPVQKSGEHPGGEHSSGPHASPVHSGATRK
jgi:hypothetical protein